MSAYDFSFLTERPAADAGRFILTESRLPLSPVFIGAFETAADAKAKAFELGCIFIEEDSDHPGHFDIFTKRGLILTITPKA